MKKIKPFSEKEAKGKWDMRNKKIIVLIGIFTILAIVINIWLEEYKMIGLICLVVISILGFMEHVIKNRE